ncbi:receptor-like protein 12 [Dorcoceras hygrometricum]|uniref:Receptor-like protein 12 n=1 Tax=Dorcoceras hygrometricum TaxID=472368 RepID=A0A2Z7BJY4_9LAMI|nr:receptor-like protein 12 [Dorcoceras hygrometricum]
MGLKDVGIDQLNFHSAQLGYLKLLQMGNTDPNQTKAGNKYEVKPQYEELSKQINMQHTINQCYECMRLSKEIGTARPVHQSAITSSRLYPRSITGNHRSVIDRGPRARSRARRFYLTNSNKARQNFTACEIDSSWFNFTAISTQNSWKLKSKNSKRLKAEATPRDQRFHEHAGLSGYLNSLPQASKSVSIERASLRESSSTKIVKNRGWMRWESTIESYGEQ